MEQYTTTSQDRRDILRAVKALDMSVALWDILALKKKFEWKLDENPKMNPFELHEEIFTKIGEIIYEDHNLADVIE